MENSIQLRLQICCDMLYLQLQWHLSTLHQKLANELLQAYQHFYTILHNAGLSPHMHKIDNKTSADIEHSIATQNAAL